MSSIINQMSYPLAILVSRYQQTRGDTSGIFALCKLFHCFQV